MPNVWPFPPQRKLKETMEWNTEVLRSRAAEQRICLRYTPRTTIDYNYQLMPQEIEAATVMAREWGASEFLLPFWQELKHVGTLAINATVITVQTETLRYKPNGFVFIITSQGDYTAVEIESVTSSTLVLKEALDRSYSGAVVMPCFPSRFSSPFKFKKYSAEYFTAESEFITTSGFPVTEENPYPSFNGSYVVTDRPILAGSPHETNNREYDTFDGLSGPLFYYASYTYAVSNSTLVWSFDNNDELWAFRKWMYIVKGKQGSFFLPRWTRDFIIAGPTVSTDSLLLVNENTYKEDSFIGDICIVKYNGDLIYATIISWSNPLALGKWQMNLENPIGQVLQVADVEMITRMPRVRFNSDRVEFSHEGAGVVNVSLPVMEVPD